MNTRSIKLLLKLLTVMCATACGSGEKPQPTLRPDPVITPKPGRFDNAKDRQSLRSLNSETAFACFNFNSSSLVDVDYVQNIDNFHVKYRTKRNVDKLKFNLDIKIAVKIMPENTAQNRKDEMLLEARSCIPKIQNIFNRYGIDLSMDIDPEIDTATSSHDRHVLYTDGYGGSNTDHWYYHGFTPAKSEDKLCLMIIHETGHYFSLRDDYTKPFHMRDVNPSSIMDNTSHGWEYIDFYPRHIQSILAPACPDYAREQGWEYSPDMQFTVR